MNRLLLLGCLVMGCAQSVSAPPAMGAGTGGTTVGGSGGDNSGSGGSGGATTGSGGAGGAQPVDDAGSGGGGSSTDAGGTAPDTGVGGSSDAAPLQECTMPSIDRLELWVATMGEGNMMPSGGNILVKEGDHYVGKIVFVGNGWHVVPVYASNDANGQVDLSRSAGFTLTYSATSDFYIQLRPGNHWGGDQQFGAKVPSTGGATQSQFIALTAATWGRIPGLSAPAQTFAATVNNVRGLVMVGDTANTIVFSGLRFDNYIPDCR
ncbi:MAG TPA: hypothetical protein VH374_19835 [Polyangia bacterium]|nr:hypothetical protein [Polyangia bacterium]